MRRLPHALALALLASLALALPARASDHLMRINEVFPGSPGGPQFVELLDSYPEPFPSGPYKLIVYTATGATVGRVLLPQSELIATGTSPYLVANAAHGGLPDEPLTVALPAAGQLCYTRGEAETKIHCVSYGCPGRLPFNSEAGSEVIGYIGATWSGQRQEGGHFGVGRPTPDAANARLSSVPCEAPAPDPFGGVDRTKPVAKLGGRRRQRLSKLAVTVTVDEDATVTARGSVRAGRRRLALKRIRRAVRAGRKATLRLKLSRRARGAVRAALRRRRKVAASVTVTVTDGSGNASTTKRAVRVLP